MNGVNWFVMYAEATYAEVPSGETATIQGDTKLGSLAVTWFVEAFITWTEPSESGHGFVNGTLSLLIWSVVT